ncbi:precorrin-6A/cobalt-precorrin-6A reductase [Devosia enhydra]|uniref:Precorrin-6A/cobalt-precorrin-6A reductase n=1 Tax=Devosia enhydra TaxID=665118 RepID=A0A1K2HXR6_9HYPH|nr:cobalt-precorrin-6A reductase [Devosia enhydra]SFZ84296.1 precorrin-6A/cobalt-precorrin-6A reductase [Devosia enhydra]
MKILVLGGTEEARILAEQLVKMGHSVTTSLAGRTSAPLTPPGELHVGGFGGPQGLADFLRKNGFDRLVDATHPYAVQIATNAVDAAKATGMRCVRLVRPAWTEPQYAFWNNVPSPEAAALSLPTGSKVLLTVGHTGLETFLAREDCRFLVRVIEAPEKPLPAHARLIVARPPFFEGAETELIQGEAITHLVTKNSGGVQTEAKLAAAQKLRISVIMIARPALPPAHEVPTVGRAIAALQLTAPPAAQGPGAG